ncbi:hypothetical protein I546_4942 [Mycobacterium kansasii 732]|nr:hypothetical protein I546_4942 [Mycobacterium kansasii 732]
MATALQLLPHHDRAQWILAGEGFSDETWAERVISRRFLL